MNLPCQAILFDLVGVLLFCREDYVPDAALDELDRMIGTVSDERLFRESACRTFSLSAAEFDRRLADIAGKYAPYQPLWELLPELHNRYKLGIINNGTYLTYPLFNARLDLEHRFDLFLSSGREGLCKPDVRIFDLACRRLGVSPEECLFMDDSRANVESARQLGMQGILWENASAGYRRFTEWLKKEKSSGIAMTIPGTSLL